MSATPPAHCPCLFPATVFLLTVRPLGDYRRIANCRRPSCPSPARSSRVVDLHIAVDGTIGERAPSRISDAGEVAADRRAGPASETLPISSRSRRGYRTIQLQQAQLPVCYFLFCGHVVFGSRFEGCLQHHSNLAPSGMATPLGSRRLLTVRDPSACPTVR